MSEYSVTVLVDASRNFTVQAESPEQAAEIADELYYEESSGLCHQCARELDVGDATAAVVYEDEKEVLNTGYMARRVADLEAERDTLRAELAALKAPAVAGDDRETVSHDAELYGIGFMVDGVRVSPDRVTIQYGRPAQTEQQPVAWQRWAGDCHELSYKRLTEDQKSRGWDERPLYTHPAQTPANQPSGCEWCAGAGHDYYGEKCNHCRTPADGPSHMGEPLVQPYEAPRKQVNELFTLLGFKGRADVGDILDAAISAIKTSKPADGLVEALAGLPDVCDGREQEAFEDYARKKGMDMQTHPLHWLFLNKETYAARNGWKAAINYCRAALAAHRAGGA